jgi:long-chain fatty acid transport protein
MERRVVMSDTLDDDIDFKLSGEDWGFGATAGILVKIIPDILNVGVGYRSGVALSFSGNAAFTKDGSGANVPSGLRSRLTDGVGSADLNLPHVVSFGVAGFPIEGLTLGVTADLITWSSYDKLEIKFTDNPELNTSDPKDWKNTVSVRVGAEYDVIKNLGVRLGFIYDMGPIPDNRIGPELPDNDRYEFCVGVGYEIIGIRIDAAYQYLFTGTFDTGPLAPLVGSYRADAHLMGLSLGYHLDI